MPKPTESYRWATDVGATTEPLETTKDTGWVAGTKPPAEEMNWLQNGAFLWFDWLLNELESDLAAMDWNWTGDHTWGTEMLLRGTTPSGAGQAFIEIDASALTGAENAIQVTGGVNGHISTQGTVFCGILDVDDIAVHSGDVVIDSGDVICTAGNLDIQHADILHTDRFITFHGFEGQGPGFSPDYSAGAGFMTADDGSSKLVIPLKMQYGEKLTEVVVFVKDTATTMTLKVKKIDLLVDPAGTPTQIGSTDTSTGTTADQALQVSGLTEVCTAAEQLYALIEAGATGHRVYGGYYVVVRE